MESIQKDIDEITKVYNDQLILTYVVAMQKHMYLKELSSFSDKLSEMKPEALKHLYNDHDVTELKLDFDGAMGNENYDMNLAVEYMEELNGYMNKKYQEVLSLTNKEDGKVIQIQKDIDVVLDSMTSMIEGHKKYLEEELRSIPETISGKKDRIKNLNQRISYMFEVSSFLENIISDILHLISKIFTNMNQTLAKDQQDKSVEAEEMFAPKGNLFSSEEEYSEKLVREVVKNSRENLFLTGEAAYYNQRAVLKESVSDLKKCQVSLHSQLDRWNEFSEKDAIYKIKAMRKQFTIIKEQKYDAIMKENGPINNDDIKLENDDNKVTPDTISGVQKKNESNKSLS